MTHKYLRILAFESFMPFLLVLVLLFSATLFLDYKIENSDTVMTINLNREKEDSNDEQGVNQLLSKENPPLFSDAFMGQVNSAIIQNRWSEASSLIRGALRGDDRKEHQLLLTLAYVEYKRDNFRVAEKLIDRASAIKDTRYYFNRGLVFSKRPHRYQDAIESFKKYLADGNRSYAANINIAHIYYRMDRYDEAFTFYMKASKLSGLGRKAKALLGAALCSEKKGEFEAAKIYLKKAIRFDPNMVSARAHLAELQLDEDPEQALGDLEGLTEIFPDYSDTYRILAEYYVDKGKPEQALKWMKSGLRQSPNMSIMRSAMGSIYLKTGDYEKAEEIFTRLTAENPEEESHWFNLARSLYGQRRLDDAMENYNKALSVKPGYYEAFVNMGIIYSQQKKYDKAIAYYNKALSIRKNSSKVYYNLGVLYNRAGQKSLSLDAYHKAIGLRPDYPAAYMNMGMILFEQKKESEAESMFAKAIELKPDYSAAYEQLSRILKKRGDLDAAIGVLQKGIGETGDGELSNLLAYLYREKGDDASAVKIWKEQVADGKENPHALLALARLYLDQSAPEKTLQYVDRYIYLEPRDPEGRYLKMIAYYLRNDFKEAGVQYKIIERISPDYKESRRFAEEMGI